MTEKTELLADLASGYPPVYPQELEALGSSQQNSMDVDTWRASRKRDRRERLLNIVHTVHSNVRTVAIDFAFEMQASQGHTWTPRPFH